MNKTLTWTFGLLALLTLAALLVSNLAIEPSTKKPLMLLLFSSKFLLVAFQFMELKKAHVAWRAAIVAVLAVINGVIAVA
jgi:Na+/glutamate symporter